MFDSCASQPWYSRRNSLHEGRIRDDSYLSCTVLWKLYEKDKDDNIENVCRKGNQQYQPRTDRWLKWFWICMFTNMSLDGTNSSYSTAIWTTKNGKGNHICIQLHSATTFWYLGCRNWPQEYYRLQKYPKGSLYQVNQELLIGHPLISMRKTQVLWTCDVLPTSKITDLN